MNVCFSCGEPASYQTADYLEHVCATCADVLVQMLGGSRSAQIACGLRRRANRSMSRCSL